MNTAPAYRVPRPAGWSAANDNRYQRLLGPVGVIEGGHSNDKTDRGGETHLGVSLRFLKANGHLDLNGDGLADLDLNFDTVLDGADIRAMTPEVRAETFLHHFYIQPGFWTLAAPFDGVMFDQAVNGGTTAAIKLMQRALNRQPGAKLAVDGAFGPVSRRRFQDVVAGRRTALLEALREEAAARYLAIIAADPSQAKYRNGWLRRARELGRV